MVKQTVAYDGLQFSSKKERTINTYNTLDGPPGYYIEWKKPNHDTLWYTVWYSVSYIYYSQNDKLTVTTDLVIASG